jgi:hypothetical protein
MYRLFLLIINLLSCTVSFAKNTYQIDLILFAHVQSANALPYMDTPLLPLNKKALVLANSTNRTEALYTLLPSSQCGLRDEFYLLNRKSPFQVLGQYSWRQSATQRNTVALDKTSSKGWLMQGTFDVQQANYYLFAANLQFSPPSNPRAAFTVSQKQRIEEGKIYYLDNPYVGMVVKIKKIT